LFKLADIVNQRTWPNITLVMPQSIKFASRDRILTDRNGTVFRRAYGWYVSVCQ
jgi:hypothetical protein